MYLKKFTLRKMQEIANDEKFNYFFGNIELEKNIDKDSEDLIEKIATMFMYEFEIDHEDFDKVVYFLRLAYWSKRVRKI